jgi:hypothetical protein
VRRESDDGRRGIKTDERKLGDERLVGASGGNPAGFQFGALGGCGMCPRRNTQSECRATQSE